MNMGPAPDNNRWRYRPTEDDCFVSSASIGRRQMGFRTMGSKTPRPCRRDQAVRLALIQVLPIQNQGPAWKSLENWGWSVGSRFVVHKRRREPGWKIEQKGALT